MHPLARSFGEEKILRLLHPHEGEHAEPTDRGGVPRGRHSLHDERRNELLPAEGDKGRDKLPPRRVEPRRRREPPPDNKHAEARHRTGDAREAERDRAHEFLLALGRNTVRHPSRRGGRARPDRPFREHTRRNSLRRLLGRRD